MGRLVYVDPVGEDIGNNITYPYEDYCIAVDLIIRIPNRYSCGFASKTGEEKLLKYSFLGGSLNDKTGNSYLTTNFTDISMTDPMSNTSECFGIESISINYNEKLFPVVTIRFIDVRGATLMSPSEALYRGADSEVESSRGLYKAFFTMPYPTFILQYKGFYGKGTTLRLTLQKADIEFNSENGNFNINATFIGQMYGIYADLPLTYLAIAPYTAEGNAYWNKQVQNGRFKFRDSSKKRVHNMVKLPELRNKIANISANQKIIKIEKEKEVVKDELDGKKEAIKKLFDEYPFTKDWDKFKSPKYYYLMVPTLDKVKEIGKNVYEYYQKVVNYESGETDKKFTKKLELDFLSTLKPEKISKTLLSKYSIKIKMVNDTTFEGENYYDEYTLRGDDALGSTNEKAIIPYENKSNPYNGTSEGVIDATTTTEEFKKALKDNSQKEGQNSYVYLCFFKKISATDIFGNVQQEQKKIEKKKEEVVEKYENAKLQLIQEVIGFKPSVRNMYELIFAHMETFMHCFYSNMKEIKTELDKQANARKKTYQGVSDESVDVPRVQAEVGRLKNLYSLLPPYTAFYKTNGNEAPKMVLPSEVAKKANELREMNFIDSLISASQTYLDDSVTAPTASTTSTTTEVKPQATPSADVSKFIPLTAYDFINKDKIGNPYSIVNEYLNGKIEDIEALIIGIFALRVYHFLPGDTDTRDDRITCGGVEAINLFKAVGDKLINKTNHGNAFLDFVKKYAEGDDLLKDRTRFVKILSETSDKSIWGVQFFEGDDTGLTTFKQEMLPMGDFKPSKLKTAYNTNSYDDTFLDTTVKIEENYKGNGPDRKVLSNSKTAKSFFIFDDRTYCKQIVENIKKFINSEEATTAYGARVSGDKIEVRKTVKIEKAYGRMLNSTLENDGNDVYYHEDAFEGIKEKEIKTIANTGEGKYDDKFFIKYPSWINDKISNGSIIGHNAYKLNKDNIAFQAYLFLHSLPIMGLDDNDGNIMRENKNGIALKSLLLREGALYWYKDNHNTVKNSGSVDGCNVSFLKAPGERFYVRDSANVKLETVEILPTDDEKGYDMWKYPVNCTESRINTLKQMFIDWANGEFKTNKVYLEDVNLYNEGKFSKGLKKSTGLTGDLNEKINDLQKFLKDTFFDAYTIIDLYDDVDTNFKAGENQKIKCDALDIERAFKFFMKQLEKIYGAITKDIKEKGQETVERTINAAQINKQNNYATSDARLSTYMALKSLYEKWLCTPHSGPDKTWTLDSSAKESDFNRFVYLDSFQKDIGDEFLVNLGSVDEWLSSCLPTINKESSEVSFALNTKSVYELLALMAEKSGAMLMAVPQKLGEYNSRNIKDLFKPLPINSDWLDKGENFVFMYSYQASKHLGTTEMQTMDANGYPGDGDGVNLEKDGDKYFAEDGLPVPGFAVTYAKQNQSLFKNIRLNTTDAGITDVSIANTMNIASQAATGPRETYLYGQDIYHVNSNKSFMCEVECMGNAQIVPLMYFQLNNIPFWGGAYQVLKVSHDITPGNFVTKFKGIRLNRYKIPMTKGEIIVTKRKNKSTTTSSGGGTTRSSGGGGTGRTIRNFDYEANPSHTLPKDKITVDFDPNNVSWKNPIICLLPGHGPKTNKPEEWTFNYSVVAKMKEILSKKTHKVDGKDVKYNVQCCNKKDGKGGAHYTGAKYSQQEVIEFCQKYGSQCVISVAVHWNGSCGNAAHVYVYNDKSQVRTDTNAFADIMVNSFNAMSGDIAKLTDVPSGMSSGASRKINLHVIDGGVNINCACILTENYFADYPKEHMIVCKNDKGVVSYKFNETDALIGSIPPYYSKVDGRYATVRGWFEGGVKKKVGDEPYVTDGVITIANGNVNGIVAYIESLQKLTEPRVQSFTQGATTSAKLYDIDYEAKIQEMINNGAPLINLTVEGPKVGIKVDLRYSTSDNITKVNLYGNNLKNIYIRKDLFEKLKLVQTYIGAQNLALSKKYQLIVYDGSRPDSIQYFCKNYTPSDVAILFGKARGVYDSSGKCTKDRGAANGSVHTFCNAVDVSIWDMTDGGNGKKLPMGGSNSDKTYDFDEQDKVSQRSLLSKGWSNSLDDRYKYLETLVAQGKITDEQKNNRWLLFNAMAAGGLYANANEWWHFQAESDDKARVTGKDTCLFF